MQMISSIGTPIIPMRTEMISKNVMLRNRRTGMRGISWNGGVSGFQCSGNCGGKSGLGAVSIDTLINDAFGWASGTVQQNLGPTAAIPPGLVGSASQWLPYLLVGGLVYFLMSKRG